MRYGFRSSRSLTLRFGKQMLNTLHPTLARAALLVLSSPEMKGRKRLEATGEPTCWGVLQALLREAGVTQSR